uniref:Uncharacterized protein n=1 Tax=Arundo donax TaxID=35708 RepID=A0A0A8YVY4_ARUDO
MVSIVNLPCPSFSLHVLH